MNEPKPKRDRSGRYLRKVNVAKDGRKLANILSREIDHLLVAVKARKLDKIESTTLCEYLKLWKELSTSGAFPSSPDSMTDAQLEALAKQAK